MIGEKFTSKCKLLTHCPKKYTIIKRRDTIFYLWLLFTLFQRQQFLQGLSPSLDRVNTHIIEELCVHCAWRQRVSKTFHANTMQHHIGKTTCDHNISTQKITYFIPHIVFFVHRGRIFIQIASWNSNINMKNIEFNFIAPY